MTWLQIRSVWRLLLCLLLCVGATLDDLEYISSVRAPRTMNNLRANSAMEEDSDDQHSHGSLVSVANQITAWSAPVLAMLHPVVMTGSPQLVAISVLIRSGRAPPSREA